VAIQSKTENKSVGYGLLRRFAPRNDGFTLAEVLITLVIIGVIAAITIPTMNNKKEEESIKTSLKKNYSVFSQVFNRYYLDNGVRLLSTDLSFRGLRPILFKYVTRIKECGWGYQDAEGVACVAQNDFANVYKTYNGATGVSSSRFDDGQFILPDGTTIFVNTDNLGVFVSVDVNGYLKKPNRLGKDLFMFELTSNGKFLPGGAKGTTYYSENDEYCSASSNSGMNGAGCTYKILQQQ